ncbi:MAG: class IIb bacteriocin, lactobin A/cerein 7B family [Pseudohongiella sp.]|uniref:class IIb bacteriocin, lactobin A/cerein 7B family n=1 Tax=Pseudohongiella sp. TaxID=1979412 RepID=UPI00349FEB80
MQVLDEKEIQQVSGGGFFLAPAVVKGVVWAAATVSGTAAAYFAYDVVSDS